MASRLPSSAQRPRARRRRQDVDGEALLAFIQGQRVGARVQQQVAGSQPGCHKSSRRCACRRPDRVDQLPHVGQVEPGEGLRVDAVGHALLDPDAAAPSAAASRTATFVAQASACRRVRPAPAAWRPSPSLPRIPTAGSSATRARARAPTGRGARRCLAQQRRGQLATAIGFGPGARRGQRQAGVDLGLRAGGPGRSDRVQRPADPAADPWGLQGHLFAGLPIDSVHLPPVAFRMWRWRHSRLYQRPVVNQSSCSWAIASRLH